MSAILDALIAEHYAKRGGKFISTTYGIPNGTVGRRAWQLGITCKIRSKLSAASRSANLNNCVQDYFEKWSSNMAYLLGFIWTDGTIRADGRHYNIGVRVHCRDEHIIHDIKQEFQSTAAIQRFAAQQIRGGKYVGGPQVGISISCMRLVKSIMGLGVLPNKSNINPCFPLVDDGYLNHFVRGVVDGDGSIHLGQKKTHGVIIYGSHRFIHELANRVSFFAGIKRPRVLSVGSSPKLRSIAWTAVSDVDGLLRWIYPPGNYMKLERKWKKAKHFFELVGGAAP